MNPPKNKIELLIYAIIGIYCGLNPEYFIMRIIIIGSQQNINAVGNNKNHFLAHLLIINAIKAYS